MPLRQPGKMGTNLALKVADLTLLHPKNLWLNPQSMSLRSRSPMVLHPILTALSSATTIGHRSSGVGAKLIATRLELKNCTVCCQCSCKCSRHTYLGHGTPFVLFQLPPLPLHTGNIEFSSSYPTTYDHRLRKTGHPVRSAIHKP